MKNENSGLKGFSKVRACHTQSQFCTVIDYEHFVQHLVIIISVSKHMNSGIETWVRQCPGNFFFIIIFFPIFVLIGCW